MVCETLNRAPKLHINKIEGDVTRNSSTTSEMNLVKQSLRSISTVTTGALPLNNTIDNMNQVIRAVEDSQPQAATLLTAEQQKELSRLVQSTETLKSPKSQVSIPGT